MRKAFNTRGYIVAAVFALAIAGAGQGAMAAGKFVTGFSDLPLMTGMTEIPDTDVAFDTTTGRIVIAFARTQAAPDQIRSFYQAALAQLGWQERSPGVHAREGEVLSFDYLADGPDTIVRFSLLPE
jgi:hypothetical protein